MLNIIPKVVLSVLFALACSSPSPAASAELDFEGALRGAKSFTDVSASLTDPQQIDAWYRITSALADDFDEVCGDTFCEGDYSNYESLGFRCSVNGAGKLGKCVWMFAASTYEVVPRSGEITVQARTWTCTMPLAENTRLATFLRTLTNAGDRPLFAPLPGTTQSLYDGLAACL